MDVIVWYLKLLILNPAAYISYASPTLRRLADAEQGSGDPGERRGGSEGHDRAAGDRGGGRQAQGMAFYATCNVGHLCIMYTCEGGSKVSKRSRALGLKYGVLCSNHPSKDVYHIHMRGI